jgi:hypothetical protein
MDLAAVRAGLADQLATIAGLRTYAYQPDTIATPCAIVLAPVSAVYTTDFDGDVELTIPILVLVQRVNERTADAEISRYLSSTGSDSIKVAIDADTTLGGVAQYTTVNGFAPFTEEFDPAAYLAVTIDCTVVAA